VDQSTKSGVGSPATTTAHANDEADHEVGENCSEAVGSDFRCGRWQAWSNHHDLEPEATEVMQTGHNKSEESTEADVPSNRYESMADTADNDRAIDAEGSMAHEAEAEEGNSNTSKETVHMPTNLDEDVVMAGDEGTLDDVGELSTVSITVTGIQTIVTATRETTKADTK
jgi:hypothetical protein